MQILRLKPLLNEVDFGDMKAGDAGLESDIEY